jgi:hypothetical protein
MNSDTAEIVRLCEALTEEKRMEIIGFARFLLTRSDQPEAPSWEALLADPARPPKLEVFHEESAAGDGDVPLKIRRPIFVKR